MAFHDHQYSVLLVLAAPGSTPIWKAGVWSSLASSLQPFTSSTRGKAAVRSLQYDAKGKAVSFGRLGWDDRSVAKWTHGDQGHESRRFADVEAWVPSWNQCEKDNSAPDFYFAVANEQLLGRGGKQLLFGQRVIAAMRMEAEPASHARLQGVMRDIALSTSAPIFVHTSRQWGISTGTGFSRSIQDMLIGHLFRPGDPHARALDLATFSEQWAHVE